MSTITFNSSQNTSINSGRSSPKTQSTESLFGEPLTRPTVGQPATNNGLLYFAATPEKTEESPLLSIQHNEAVSFLSTKLNEIVEGFRNTSPQVGEHLKFVFEKIISTLQLPSSNTFNMVLGMISICNAVLSTLPEFVSASSRFRIVGAEGLALYSISLLVGTGISQLDSEKGKEVAQTVSWCVSNLSIFANNLNFSFDTVCRIMGEFLTDNYTGTVPYLITGAVIAGCVVFSAVMVAGFNRQKKDDFVHKMYEFFQAFSISFAFASFVSSILRIEKTLASNLNSRNSVLMILVAQGIGLLCYGIAAKSGHSDVLKLFTKEKLNTFTNLIGIAGLTVEAVSIGDDLSTGLLAGIGMLFLISVGTLLSSEEIRDSNFVNAFKSYVFSRQQEANVENV